MDSPAAIRDRYAEKGGVLSFRPKRPDRFRSRPTSVPRAPEDELRGALILAGRRIAQINFGRSRRSGAGDPEEGAVRCATGRQGTAAATARRRQNHGQKQGARPESGDAGGDH
jgi:hypothetical protein